jgi:hypothetical protein
MPRTAAAVTTRSQAASKIRVGPAACQKAMSNSRPGGRPRTRRVMMTGSGIGSIVSPEAQDAYAKVADCCRACPVSFTCKTPRDGTQPRTLPTNRNTTVASRRLEETDGARGRAGAPGTSPRLSGGWLNRGFGRSISRGTEGTQKSRNLLIKAPPIPSGRPRPAVGCAPATHNRRPPREDSVSGGFFRAPSCIGDRHRTRAARSPAYGGRRSDPSA